MDLTEAQARAVRAPAIPQLVIAGPGTGKTRVLVARAAYLIREAPQPVAPGEVVLITFTTRAAAQLRRRLAALIGPRAQAVRAGTLHHFAHDLLSRHGARVGLSPDFLVADAAAQEGFWQLWAQRNGHRGKKYRDLMALVSRAKLGLAPLPEALQPGLAAYTHFLSERDALDFDDLLTRARDLLRDHAEARAEVQAGIGALLVDEFQDTDPVQYETIRLALDPARPALTCVADDDQSIYGFRGAVPERVERFIADFGCCRERGDLHVLDLNYRSSPAIFSAAETVLGGTARLKRTGEIRVHDTDAAPIHLVPCVSSTHERILIRQLVETWLDGGVPRREVAVFTPWNSLNSDVEAAFLRAGIPCETSGGKRLMAAPVVRQLVALCHLLARRLDGPVGQGEMAAFLQTALSQHVYGLVEARAQLQYGESVPFIDKALNDLVTTEAARREVGLPPEALAELEAVHALMANLIARARRGGETVGALIDAALGDLSAPLQLLTRHLPALSDPLGLSADAAQAIRRWHEGPAEARLIVHGSNPTRAAVWAELLGTALGGNRDEADAPPTRAIHPWHFLPRTGTRPLDARDLVLTDAPAAFRRAATRAGLLRDDAPGPTLLALGAGDGEDDAPADAIRVDPANRYESPTVRLFKLAQAALAVEARPLYPSYAMVDLETTGVDPRSCRPVEIGALIVENGIVTARFETRIALPDDLADEEWTVLRDVSGFAPSDFDGAPTEAAAWAAFCAFVGSRPLVAHNGHAFDFRVLDGLRKRYTATAARWTITHDTLPDARQLHPELRAHGAAALRRDLLGETSPTAHRALADCVDQQRFVEAFQETRARRSRLLAAEPALAALAVGVGLETERQPTGEAATLFDLGYRLALRGTHPTLRRLRTLLGRDPAEALRAEPRLRDRLVAVSFEQDDRDGLLELRPRLEALVAPFADRPVRGGLRDLLTHLALWGAEATDGAADVVTISTYHSAKGLEFSHVVCAHVHSGAFPSSHQRTEAERAESRRVLYVGMTRAKRLLTLTHPLSTDYGRTTGPSPFLAHLPPDRTLRYPVFGSIGEA